MSSRRRRPGFDGDNIAGFENEAMEAQIRFETSRDQKRKNYSSKKFEKKEWERPPLVFRCAARAAANPGVRSALIKAGPPRNIAGRPPVFT